MGSQGVGLFAGSGYNVSFFTIGIVLGMPWMFLLARRRAGRLGILAVGLFIPLFLTGQRAFVMASAVLAGVCLLFSIRHAIRGGKRSLVRWRDVSGRRIVLAFLMVAASVVISLMWFKREGFTNDYTPASRRLSEMQQHDLFQKERPAETMGTPKAVVSSEIETRSFQQRIEQWLIRHDWVRGPMWVMGFRESIKSYRLRGSGAGTWARFHRSQPRPYGPYYAHMHNTCLDLMFEYGILLTVIIAMASVTAFMRIAFLSTGPSRLWIFYLVGIAVMALGQHLLYAFTSMCLLLPAFIIISKSLIDMFKMRGFRHSRWRASQPQI